MPRPWSADRPRANGAARALVDGPTMAIGQRRVRSRARGMDHARTIRAREPHSRTGSADGTALHVVCLGAAQLIGPAIGCALGAVGGRASSVASHGAAAGLGSDRWSARTRVGRVAPARVGRAARARRSVARASSVGRRLDEREIGHRVTGNGEHARCCCEQSDHHCDTRRAKRQNDSVSMIAPGAHAMRVVERVASQ